MFNCVLSKKKPKTLAVILHFKITLSLLVIPLSGESALRSHDATPQYNLLIFMKDWILYEDMQGGLPYLAAWPESWGQLWDRIEKFELAPHPYHISNTPDLSIFMQV